MININNLARFGRDLIGRTGAAAHTSVAVSTTARIWPGRPVAAIFLLFTTCLGLAGCGHATVPCPTPTDQLDRLRGETERLHEDADRARAEEEAFAARREAAAERAEAAQARLDSLKAGRRR